MGKQKWDRHEILSALHRKGMTLTRLAEMNGKAPGGFRTIWSRPNTSTEQIIAKFLGVPAEELFPDRYPKRTTSILSHEYVSESTGARKVA